MKKAEEEFPLCPFCNEEVRTVLCKEIYGVLGKRYIYFCSGCKKTLGVSHRKGLLLG